MTADDFGANDALPEDAREVFMHLCQEVASLHDRWEFYRVLFGRSEGVDLRNNTAPESFPIVDEAVRNEMAMAIGRLNDPADSHETRSGRRTSLSMKGLANLCPDVPGIEAMVEGFRAACRPVNLDRDRSVSRGDDRARVEPHEGPVPGVRRSEFDAILGRAAALLNAVSRHYTNGGLSYDFHPVALGDADALLTWLGDGWRRWGQERARWRRAGPFQAKLGLESSPRTFGPGH